jgi:hypothetical protein
MMRTAIVAAIVGVVTGFTPFVSQAQSLPILRFESVPAAATQDVAFPLRLIALDSGGAPLTNFVGPVLLSARQLDRPTPVISEISRDAETIEFTNPADIAVDVSGWELEAVNSGNLNQSFVRLRIPSPAVVPPRGTFTWSSTRTAPGTFPNFGASKPFQPPAYELAAVHLRNPQGQLIDAVLITDQGRSPATQRWSSHPQRLPQDPLQSLQRIGSRNTFSTGDWQTNSPSPGTTNPGLTFPWTGERKALPVTPESLSLSNGTTQGTATITEPAEAVFLVADAGDGRLFESAPFPVAPRPTLALVVPTAAASGTESSPGPVGQGTVSLPAPGPSPAVVTLNFDSPDEFSAPAQIVIPAGETRASFTITNLDDTVADGRARVLLTASAAGFGSSSAFLLNDDNESAELQLVLPSPVQEASGFQSAGGRVLLASPAIHDVEVQLTGSPLIQVPATVVIPAGRIAAAFPVRINDDGFVNPAARRATLRASSGAGPGAEVSLEVIDDDDRLFTVELPSQLVEGEPVSGIVRFATPRDHPISLTWRSDHGRLTLPSPIQVPPGTRDIPFTVQLPDNATLDGEQHASVCTFLGDAESVCLNLRLLDNEAEVDGVVFSGPRAAFGGEPVPTTLGLRDRFQATPRTNVSAELRLAVHPQLAASSPQPFPLTFSNGLFRGGLRFSGEALGAGLELQVAGRTFQPATIDILRGHTIAGMFTDVAVRPGAQHLLALGGGSTNFATQLIEIDPASATTNRTLPLSKPAHRLSISDDGSVAWLASTDSSLQRIDLANWRTGAVVFLTNSVSPARPEALLVLSGGTDRLLVLINEVENDPPGMIRDLHAIAVIDGNRRSNSVIIPNASVPGHLIPGRTPGEAILDWGGRIHTLAVQDDGVRATTELFVGFGFPGGIQPNLIRWGDLLYRGSGEVLSIEPLARTDYQPNGSWVALAEEGRRLAFLGANGDFSAVERLTFRRIGQHAVPWPEFGGVARNLIQWADGSFAALTGESPYLLVWKSPILAAPPADLAVSGTGPESVEARYTNGLPIANTFEWTWTVTNRGPGTAQGTLLTLDTGAPHVLGSMAPGEIRTITESRGGNAATKVRGTASVTSSTTDPNLDNNSAHLRTDVQGQTLGHSRQLLVDARHMVGSADGQTLWLAVAAPEFEGGPALVELDPASGLPIRRRALNANPEQIAATADGRYVYARLGTSRIIRWNLETNAIDLDLPFTDESVTDFLSLPSSSRTIVVSTTRRLVVFDDATARPASILDSAEPRYLGFSIDRLWVVQPGQLRRYRVDANGLVPDGEATPLSPPLGNLRFSTDSRRLYFSGMTVDLESGNALPGPTDWPWVTDSARGVVYSAVGPLLRRYDAISFAPRSEEAVPGFVDAPVAMARWGVGGLAVLGFQGQLWIGQPSVVPEPTGGDLVLTLTSPVAPTAYEPFEWTLTVSNPSSEPVTRCRLVLQRFGAFREMSIEGAPALDYLGAHYLDLGDLAPASTKTVRVRATLNPGSFNLRATLATSSPADLPNNNVAESSGNVGFPQGDLAASLLSAPTQVSAGQPFSVRVRVTNAGPTAAGQVGLQLSRPFGVEYLSVTPGSIDSQCCGEVITASIGSLAAGASVDVEIQLQRPEPGLTVVGIMASSGLSETNVEDNRVTALVQTTAEASVPGFRRFEYPPGQTVWSGTRQELVAIFDTHRAVVLLGPDSLDLRAETPLPGLPQQVAVSHDGESAWIGLAGGDVVRVNLNARSVVAQFPFEINSSVPFGAFATVPGQPDTLIGAGITSRGQPRVVAYRNGTPLPRTVEGLRWSGNGFFLAPGRTNRLYVSSGLELREVLVDASGVTGVRSLDTAASFGGPISAVPEHLAFSTGRLVNLASLTPDDRFVSPGTLIADPAVSTIFRCLPDHSQFGGPPLTLEARNGTNLENIWRIQVPPSATIFGDFSRVVPMGARGLLLVAFRALRIDGTVAGVAQTDLSLSVPAPDPLMGVDAPITVSVAIAHHGPWAARDSALEIEVSGVLELTQPDLPLLQGQRVLPLGTLDSSTNITLVLRPTSIGDGSLRLRVRSALPDLNPSDNEIEWRVHIPGPPVFVVDDSPVPEGTDSFAAGSVTAVLTSAAPTDWEVPFRVTPLSANENDLTTLEGVFRFARGATTSAASIIRSDFLAERNETFRLEFLPSPVALGHTSAVITIVDDDLPWVSVKWATFQEGHRGVTSGLVPIVLSDPAEYPMEVRYQTVAGTATPGTDYIHSEGWLRFETGQGTNLVAVPVIGDTMYEPADGLFVELMEAPLAKVLEGRAPVGILNDDAPPVPTIALRPQPDGSWRVHFDTIDGARYRLQVRGSLNTGFWTTLAGQLIGNGQPGSFPIPTGLRPPQFFRVRVE